jgi:hypothetical protein
VALVAAVVGLSLNVLFLSIRAGLYPPINEGEPTTWESLKQVVTRFQYQKPPLSERQADLVSQYANYFQYFSWQFGKDWDIALRYGTAMLFGGLGTLFVAFILRAGRDELISSWTAEVELVESLREMLDSVIFGLYSAGLRPLWLQGVLISGGGLVLWFITRRSKSRPKVSADPVQESRSPESETRVIPSSDELEEPGEPPSGIFG